MRLHLIIKRHCLPTERVIWTVGAQPTGSSVNSSSTIAQLLEAVNEILPLESGEWGLVDYTVEVRGFECLHFSELSHVLKEDDEVCIRPLQSSDIRARRASGRSQILSGGMKLVDGIPFGRPYRGQSIRPPIPEIPPRKRRRLLYGVDDEEGEAQWEIPADRQLVVRENFEDEDENASEKRDTSSAEDSLEEDEADDEQDMDEELAFLLQDQVNNQELGRSPLHAKDELASFTNSIRRSKRTSGRHARNNQQAKTGASTIRISPGDLKRQKRKASESSNKSVRFEDRESDTPVTIHRSDLSDASTDEQILQKSLTGFESEGSDKENTEPLEDDSSEASSTESTSPVSMSIEYGLSGDESNDDVSSDSDSSSDTSSDTDDESSTPSVDSDVQNSGVDVDSSEVSTSDSSSNDDSDSEEDSPTVEKTSNQGTARSHVRSGDPQLAASTFEKALVSPGQGKAATKRRNVRRRKHNLLKRLQREGKLPEDATLADLPLVEAENRAGTTCIAEAKRSLLKSLDLSGTIRLDADKDPSETTAVQTSDKEIPELTSTVTESGSLSTPETQATSIPPRPMQSSQPESVNLHSATSETVVDEPGSQEQTSGPRPRMKIDLASSRRMLFGALGLSTPKTKQDEEKARTKLAIQARRPTKTANDENIIRRVEDGSLCVSSDDEYENWQERIKLNAVECCHSGITLSTPPFPFIQRWDPQQQASDCKIGGKSRKGRNKKKRKRHAETFEEGLLYDDMYMDPSKVDNPPSSAKHLRYSDDQIRQDTGIAEEEYHVSSQPASIESRSQAAIDDQLQREVEEVSGAGDILDPQLDVDLPELPDNLALYPDMTNDDLTPATIIAFKKLDMSVETNWQPLISDYKIAVITDLLDDGFLKLRLAARDAPKPRDVSDTGEVVYSKFEMPDFGDNPHVSDARIIEIAFAELIEPKVVQRVGVQLGKIPESSNNADVDKLTYPITRAEAAGKKYDIGQSETIRANGDTPPFKLQSMTEPITSRPGIPHSQAHLEAQISGEARNIIKDAGWNSSINIENGDRLYGAAQEPRISTSLKDSAMSEQQSEYQPQSPSFNGFGSSPPPTSDVQVPSSPQNRVNGHHDDNSQSGDDTASSDHLAFAVPDTVPEPILDVSPAFSQISSYSPSPPRIQRDPLISDGGVNYPDLALQPSSHDCNDIFRSRLRRTSLSKKNSRQSQRDRHSSSSPLRELGTSPPPLSKSCKVEIDGCKARSKLKGSRPSQRAPSSPALIVAQHDNCSGSDSDLPDLATILSQPSQRQVSQVLSTSVVVKRSDSESRDFTPRQRPSQNIGNETQIVDLLSSDNLESVNVSGEGSKYISIYESQVLPSGSDWIKKSQAQQI